MRLPCAVSVWLGGQWFVRQGPDLLGNRLDRDADSEPVARYGHHGGRESPQRG